MTLVLHLFILLQYVVSSSWTLYKLTSFSTICIRLYVSLCLEYLLRNHSANIIQSQMSYCIIYVHLIKGLKMYLSFHSLFSRWLISQLTIMEEDDVHYCMKCKTEIQGLEQYIQHRKDGCPANAKPQGKFKWWCVWFIFIPPTRWPKGCKTPHFVYGSFSLCEKYIQMKPLIHQHGWHTGLCVLRCARFHTW